MRAIDLMEDGFPHGTREGYEQGCHSKGACMGPLDGLPTCTDAFARSRTDMSYRRRLEAGMTVHEIAAEDKALTEELRSKPKAKPAGEIGVEQSVEPIRQRDLLAAEVVEDLVDDVDEDLEDLVLEAGEQDAPDAVSSSPSSPSVDDVDQVHETGDDIAWDKHGTTAGYSAGCRRKDECPGIERVGVSCTQAVADYQRDLKERKRAAAGIVAPKPAPPKEPQQVAEPEAVAEAKTEHRVDEVLAELADARADVERLQGELDGALADCGIEKAARESLQFQADTLNEQVGELTAQRIHADELRLDAEKDASALRDRVATLTLELDVAKSPDALPQPAGVGLATVPSAPVASGGDVVAPRTAMGLDIRPTNAGGVVVRLEGGEPIQLSLQFTDGHLRDVGVKVGA